LRDGQLPPEGLRVFSHARARPNAFSRVMPATRVLHVRNAPVVERAASAYANAYMRIGKYVIRFERRAPRAPPSVDAAVEMAPALPAPRALSLTARGLANNAVEGSKRRTKPVRHPIIVTPRNSEASDRRNQERTRMVRHHRSRVPFKQSSRAYGAFCRAAPRPARSTAPTSKRPKEKPAPSERLPPLYAQGVQNANR